MCVTNLYMKFWPRVILHIIINNIQCFFLYSTLSVWKGFSEIIWMSWCLNMPLCSVRSVLLQQLILLTAGRVSQPDLLCYGEPVMRWLKRQERDEGHRPREYTAVFCRTQIGLDESIHFRRLVAEWQMWPLDTSLLVFILSCTEAAWSILAGWITQKPVLLGISLLVF